MDVQLHPSEESQPTMDSQSILESQPTKQSQLTKSARVFNILPPPYSLIDDENFKRVAEWYTNNVAKKPTPNIDEKRIMRHERTAYLLVLILLVGSCIAGAIRSWNKTWAERALMRDVQAYVGIAIAAGLQIFLFVMKGILEPYVIREYLPVVLVLAFGLANFAQCTIGTRT